jgi:hypothetical protein
MLIRADAYGGEHGDITHNAVMAHLFVASIEDKVFDYAQRTLPPRFEFFVVDFHSEVTRSACYFHGGLTHVLIWMPFVKRLTHHYHIVETGNDSFWLKPLEL